MPGFAQSHDLVGQVIYWGTNRGSLALQFTNLRTSQSNASGEHHVAGQGAWLTYGHNDQSDWMTDGSRWLTMVERFTEPLLLEMSPNIHKGKT